MFKIIKIVIFIFIIIIAINKNTLAVLLQSSLQHDGNVREYIVYKPDSLVNTPCPLIFMFHGGGGTNYQVMSKTAENRWNELADQNSFIMVYPQGLNKNWNDCRADHTIGSNEDDVGFIDAIITSLNAHYIIDSNKIYACGMSNGGIFSFRLAIERSDIFAAIFSCAGALPAVSKCPNSPSSPISIMYLAGTEDQYIPYAGGVVAPFLGTEHGSVLSAEDSVNYWKTHLQISETPKINSIPNIVDTDGSTVVTYTYTQGAGGSDIKYYEVIGGGHAWPAATPSTIFEEITLKLGKKNQDMLACDEAWTFFHNKNRILNTLTPTITLTPLIEPLLFFKEITAYPNPADQQLKFQWLYQNVEKAKVNIYNFCGECISTVQVNQPGMSLTWKTKDIPSGCYFYQIKIILISGFEKRHTGKIVILHN